MASRGSCTIGGSGLTGGNVVVKRTRFWQVLRDQRAVKLLAQLWMGSHSLAIETGRWIRPQRVPSAQRGCPLCNSGEVEDEMHFVFECQGLAEVRGRYPSLFAQGVVLRLSDAGMNECMNPVFTDEAEARAFWPRLSAFVAECWVVRNAAVDELG